MMLAGFRTSSVDALDEALTNWAIWATQSSGVKTAEPGGGAGHDTDGTKREAHHETKEVCQIGWAMDVEKELVQVQTQVDARLRFNSWNVRDTVRRWYHGTGTDEYEAEQLGIPRQTFSDRIDQVKKRIDDNRAERLSSELSNKLQWRIK